MITKIHIENFKGFKDRQTIELKPITLLFGPNSGGKSTIIQAIHYMQEILKRKNFDPRGTVTGGDVIDLGSFENLVFMHDMFLPIKLEFEMDISEEKLPEYYSEIEHDFYYSNVDQYELYDCIREINTISVKVEVRWHEILQRVDVAIYETYINGVLMAAITLDNYTTDGRSYYKISYFNFGHPIFPTREKDIPGMKLDDWKGKIPKSFIKKMQESIFTDDFIVVISLFYDLNRYVASKERYSLMSNDLDLKLKSNTAVPEWGKLLPIDPNYFGEDKDNAEFYNYINFFTEVLSMFVVGPGELLVNELNEFRYIGPMREIPPRNFLPQPIPDQLRWSKGLGVWDTIYSKPKKFLDNVNRLLKLLKVGYNFEMKSYRELPMDSLLMQSIKQGRVFDDINLKKEIDKLTTRQRLYLIDNERFIELLPQDIGVGISQIVPVIVGSLDQKSSILAIEQPELHVHPAIQVNLGDLFISQITNKDCIFLLETHSEHLILRLLRRIEENNNQVQSDFSLTRDKLSVVWVENTEEGIKLTQLPVDETGEFTKPWPKGFFEERAEELFR